MRAVRQHDVPDSPLQDVTRCGPVMARWPNPGPRRAWDGRPIQPGDLRLAVHQPA
jgi:hypothetical protein